MMQIFYLLLCCLLGCWLPAAEAAEQTVTDDNTQIYADHMSQNHQDEIYTADGHVVVVRQDMNLTADQARYTAATHMLYATGSVVLTKGGAVLKGETLVLNMDTGVAEMNATLLTVPETGMKVRSDKLVRISDNVFTAQTTEMTTCDIPDPSWKFGADNLKVNLLGYATGRNIIFYIKDTPVLYLPWFAFPAVLEKRTGLLFPHFGYSKSRGVQLDVPAYLVISPSQDLQLDLDMMTVRGVGTGLDYRYIRTRGSEGHTGVYSIYDQSENRWRWQLSQEHKEIFSSSANLRMSVNTTGDRTFLNDFGEKSGDYNRQSNDSTVNALKTWQTVAATAYLRYNEDLYSPDNRATVQTLPSLGVAAVRQSVFSLPLYFDLDGAAENLYRDSAPSGQRFTLFPRVTLLPFHSGYVQTSLFAGAHLRGYATDRRGSISSVNATDGDLLPEAGGRVSTSLTRIYETNATQLKKIRHEVIPELSYSIMPGRDQERLPSYDYTDRMIHQNMVSLSVTNLFNGKFVSNNVTEYRDIARIKFEARYSIAGEQRDILTPVQSQHRWSDLIFESDTWLNRMVRLTGDARYNLYDNAFSTAVAGVTVDDKQGNTLGAGYQLARNDVEYFEGRLATKLIKPLTLSYTARYSFDRGDFLESVYAAEYRHKCWSVNVAIHQRTGNPSYTINFNLAGLGSK